MHNGFIVICIKIANSSISQSLEVHRKRVYIYLIFVYKQHLKLLQIFLFDNLYSIF